MRNQVAKGIQIIYATLSSKEQANLITELFYNTAYVAQKRFLEEIGVKEIKVQNSNKK